MTLMQGRLLQQDADVLHIAITSSEHSGMISVRFAAVNSLIIWANSQV
jgi:hypothetical protein